jgi:DNA-binding NarL/FixJ family response regulator
MSEQVQVQPATRVAILDEYPVQALGVATALGASQSMRVVLSTVSAAALLEQLPALHVNALLLEPWMRNGDGLEVIRVVSAAHPEVAIIALSRIWTPDHVNQALDAGARAYLSKEIRTADLAAMVRHIMEGGTVRPSASSAAALPQTDLTAREQEVLCLAARGHSNAAIADELFVTAQTVKFHLSNAYRKLGVHNRTEAAHRAARMGVCG